MSVLEMKEKKCYILAIEINGKILNYTCRILDQNEDFIAFIDKFRKKFCYRKKNVISYEEISEPDCLIDSYVGEKK